MVSLEHRDYIMDIITFNMTNNTPCIIRETAYRKDDLDIFVSELMEEFSNKIMDDKALSDFVQYYSQTISIQSINRIIQKNATEDTSMKVTQRYIDIYSNIESLSIEYQRMIEKESMLSVKRNIVFVILYDIAKEVNIVF